MTSYQRSYNCAFWLYVNSYAHNCGYMVSDGDAMVAISELLLLSLTLCTRIPKIRLLRDASAARNPKIRLRGLRIINKDNYIYRYTM